MQKIFAAIVISLVAGFAAGAWYGGDAPPAESPRAGQLEDRAFDSSAPLEERLLSLEQVIAEEREARLAMTDQIDALVLAIERIDRSGPQFFADREARAQEMREQRQRERRQADDIASAARNFQDRRLARLVEGGFSDQEARRVMQQESEAQYRAMQAAWEAQRSGQSLDPFLTMANPQALLRDELGDDNYERYLKAQGAPTTVQVTQVLEQSPGGRAGLQPGDQIVSYNGNRVFNVMELRSLTMQGRPGEDVIVEVDRDGVTMQLSLPAGPIGITGSNAGVRGMNWWGGG